MSVKRLFHSSLLLIGIFLSFMTLHCGADSSSSTPDLGLSTQGCGSGTIDAGESCDDGNTENSDGCNAHCAWEVGVAVCGNGVLENEECCDDGNTNNGDGCSDTCLSERNNHPPLAPLLAANPSNGITWAPTRLYLSWSASTDSDPGDRVVYDVYFAEGPSEGTVPYKKDIRNTHFIIQASTDNRSEYFPDLVRPIYLTPNTTYTWKVCARDSKNASNCSERRVFNTDNSVVGWWRFDENPAGATCPSMPDVGGPAGDPGETVCDYSGFGNHGRPNGSPSWLPPASGILGGALNFDGVDDWISISHVPILTFNTTESLGIETKINVSSIPMSEGTFLISKGSSGSHGNYSIILNPSNEVKFTYSNPSGSAYPQYSTGLSASNGVPTRSIMTHTFGDPTSIRVNVNGTLSIGGIWTSGTGNESPNLSTDLLSIGRRSVFLTYNSYFIGTMDEMIIYRADLGNDYMRNAYLSGL